jgi:hypothetical protein
MFRAIKAVNIDQMEHELLVDGLLQVKPRSWYSHITNSQRDFFMYKHAVYCLPTQELIDWLRDNIVGVAIEIGAGNGSIGRALGIPRTDSKQQENGGIAALYALAGQPVINYPDDIEKLEALGAVAKYQPDTVIGSYITHKWRPGLENGNMYGVDGPEMMKHIKKFIMIGNLGVHSKDPLLKTKYKSYPVPWLLTRAEDQAKNRIFVFESE